VVADVTEFNLKFSAKTGEGLYLLCKHIRELERVAEAAQNVSGLQCGAWPELAEALAAAGYGEKAGE
jgi:hypothetical protein